MGKSILVAFLYSINPSLRDCLLSAIGMLTARNNIVFATAPTIAFDYLEGNCTLDQAIDLVKLNTRHYAKRQITFFKKLNVTYLQPNTAKILAKNIIEGLF